MSELVGAWARLIYDEQEAMRFLLGEEFEMIDQQTDAWIQALARDNARKVMAAMQESIVIPVLDPVKHTSEKLFCDDWDCPCHQDIENINALTEQVEAGLLTTIEANLILRGATI